jgi:MFS family permease
LQKTPPVSYLGTSAIVSRACADKYSGLNIFLWGAFLMAQAAVHSFAALTVLRILSGAFEAIADPAFMLITTMWYTTAEQPSELTRRITPLSGSQTDLIK